MVSKGFGLRPFDTRGSMNEVIGMHKCLREREHDAPSTGDAGEYPTTCGVLPVLPFTVHAHAAGPPGLAK